ncbi:MAG: hypothetical protein SFU85_13850 [Candidatus Methylacidiphilales bacterium]|nr:hypothetical protein [Candidatus Methylacidiphilales bacterium]
MIAVLFPTEYEAKDFLGALSHRSTRVVDHITVHEGKLGRASVVLAVIGMGPELSARGTESVLKHFEVSQVILAGFAGALSPQMARGQIIIVQDYSSEALINYLRLLPGFDIAKVYPSPTVVSTAEQKQAIGREFNCQIVDMETDAVARAVLPYCLDFLSIRAVSDLATEDIPNDVLSQGYNMHTGRTSPLKLIAHLAFNQDRIKAFKDFLAPLPEVRAKLTMFVAQVVKELEAPE